VHAHLVVAGEELLGTGCTAVLQGLRAGRQGHEVEPLEELAIQSSSFGDLARRVLPDRRIGERAEVVRRSRSSSEVPTTRMSSSRRALEEMHQPGDELALGEITRGAEQDHSQRSSHTPILSLVQSFALWESQIRWLHRLYWSAHRRFGRPRPTLAP
jgi:hypothetical protein